MSVFISSILNCSFHLVTLVLANNPIQGVEVLDRSYSSSSLSRSPRGTHHSSMFTYQLQQHSGWVFCNCSQCYNLLQPIKLCNVNNRTLLFPDFQALFPVSSFYLIACGGFQNFMQHSIEFNNRSFLKKENYLN